MAHWILLFLALLPQSAPAAEPAWRGPWKGVPELLPLLREVPTGRRILEQAEKKDPAFVTRIRTGEASFTESTFARTYSLVDGAEQTELKHEVVLARRLSLSHALLDLAHELVHFTEKKMMDPYQAGFERLEFVKKGIEGEGGELHALEQECLVAWELKSRYPGFPNHRLCRPYRKKDASFDRERALRDYYALGSWWEGAGEELRKGLPHLSQAAVVFTSSYARKPYPVALSEEFDTTRKVACANNRRKHQLISSQAGRVPASKRLSRERIRLKTYDRLYCSGVAQLGPEK